MPPTSELFRALCRRAVGGRSATAFLLLAAAGGALAGWLADRYLAAGAGQTPSRGLLAWLLIRYDSAALYLMGVLAALQLTSAAGQDARSGWLVQYVAAGGTRDRYALALAGAHAAGAGVLYLLTACGWLAVSTALGRPVALLADAAVRLPAGLLWLFAPAGFAAAAVALAGAGGRALALMFAVLGLPWLALAAVSPSPAAGMPAWLPWALLPSPPYPLVTSPRAACFLVGYAAAALAVAYVAAPRRLVRL